MVQNRIYFPLLLVVFNLALPGWDGVSAREISAASADDVIAAVNNLRSTYDLLPYQVNLTLMTIAQDHADYLASTGIVTHFGKDGSRPYQRAIAAGYSVAGDLSVGGLFFENVHAAAELSPSEVVEFWQRDSNNLAALVSPELVDIGVGISEASGVVYYVLDVGASTGTPAESLTPSSPVQVTFTVVVGTQSGPVITTTPLNDGAIYHEVKKDEALWSIAQAYGLTLEDLKKLNRLSSGDILEGQMLLIYQPEPSTSTPVPHLTATFGIPTSTATRPVPSTVTVTATPVPVAPTSLQKGGVVVAGIIVIALIAAGFGAWLSSRKIE